MAVFLTSSLCEVRRWKPNDRIFKARTLGDDVLVKSFRPWCKRQVGFHWRVRSNWTTLGRPTRFATRVDLSRCTSNESRELSPTQRGSKIGDRNARAGLLSYARVAHQRDSLGRRSTASFSRDSRTRCICSELDVSEWMSRYGLHLRPFAYRARPVTKASFYPRILRPIRNQFFFFNKNIVAWHSLFVQLDNVTDLFTVP